VARQLAEAASNPSSSTINQNTMRAPCPGTARRKRDVNGPRAPAAGGYRY